MIFSNRVLLLWTTYEHWCEKLVSHTFICFDEFQPLESLHAFFKIPFIIKKLILCVYFPVIIIEFTANWYTFVVNFFVDLIDHLKSSHFWTRIKLSIWIIETFLPVVDCNRISSMFYASHVDRLVITVVKELALLS